MINKQKQRHHSINIRREFNKTLFSLADPVCIAKHAIKISRSVREHIRGHYLHKVCLRFRAFRFEGRWGLDERVCHFPPTRMVDLRNARLCPVKIYLRRCIAFATALNWRRGLGWKCVLFHGEIDRITLPTDRRNYINIRIDSGGDIFIFCYASM